MSFKVFTQEEVDAILPDEYGVRYFPIGDYTAIKKFDWQCEFEAFCIFGEECKFGAEGVFGSHCSFGFGSIFGDCCSFGNSCIFSDGCSFGARGNFKNSCKFGQTCYFGSFCEFRSWCRFGAGGVFGRQCKFGEKYVFGKDCTFEGGFKSKTTLPFIILTGSGSEARSCYFYDFQEGIHVRAGCFFGTLEEFKAAVLEDEETPETPSKKTRVYLSFCDTVKIQFN